MKIIIKKIKIGIKNRKDEIRKKEVINAICGTEIITLPRVDLLLAASIMFINKEAYKEAQICNNEAIQLLNKLSFKIKENREFLKIKLAE